MQMICRYTQVTCQKKPADHAPVALDQNLPPDQSDLGSNVRVLQVPAGTHRSLASPLSLFFLSKKATYFEILK